MGSRADRHSNLFSGIMVAPVIAASQEPIHE